MLLLCAGDAMPAQQGVRLMNDRAWAFTQLLQRVLPGVETQCRGASSTDIRALANYSEGRLPAFYEWFLSQFGVHAGPFATPRFDFSIAAVLNNHREEREDGAAVLDDFVIAVGRDPLMPQDIAYDFRHCTPGDAQVTIARTPMFESLEAMLAWRLYQRHVLPSFGQRCNGVIRYHEADFGSVLDLAVEQLGFTRALATGAHAKVFDGPGCALTLLGNYHGYPTVAFELGSASSHRARALLGQLIAHGFEIQLLHWDPVIS